MKREKAEALAGEIDVIVDENVRHLERNLKEQVRDIKRSAPAGPHVLVDAIDANVAQFEKNLRTQVRDIKRAVRAKIAPHVEEPAAPAPVPDPATQPPAAPAPEAPSSPPAPVIDPPATPVPTVPSTWPAPRPTEAEEYRALVLFDPADYSTESFRRSPFVRANGSQFDIDRDIAGGPALCYRFIKDTPAAPQFLAYFEDTDNVWMAWDSLYEPGFTIRHTSDNGTGYKDPAFGFSTAERRIGIDGSNTRYGDSSIDIKEPGERGRLYGPRTDALVEHIANIGTEFTDGLWRRKIFHARAVNERLYASQFWSGFAGSAPVIQTGATPTRQIADGILVYPISIEKPAPKMNRAALGENMNQPCSKNMRRWVRRVVIVDGNKYPNPFKLSGVIA